MMDEYYSYLHEFRGLNSYKRAEANLEQDSPLRQAVKAGNLDRVKELVKCDPREINKANSKGWTLLHEAAVKDKQFNVFRFLISVGAKPDYKAENGVSPLYVACKYGSVTIARLLIEAGSDINIKFAFDYYHGRFVHCNFTALHIACARRNSKIIKLLIKKNGDVNAKDDLGRTPIHNAIRNRDVASVRMLIRAGADLIIKDFRGYSLFHYASMSGIISRYSI